jgi:CRP-like cAMP-binding protein
MTHMTATKIPARRLAMLRQVPLFSALSDDQLARVDALVDEVEVGAGKILTNQGAVGRQCFLIVDGEAKVTVNDHQVASLGHGDIVGELAILDAQPRSATVTTTTPARLLTFDPRSFKSLLSDGQIADRIMRRLVSRLRAADERLAATSE